MIDHDHMNDGKMMSSNWILFLLSYSTFLKHRPCFVATRQGVTVLNADRKQPDQLKRAIAAAT